MKQYIGHYACTACGRTFGRKSSAERHAKTVEGGAQTIVPSPMYAAGLTNGIYLPPRPRPSYGKTLPEVLAETFMIELAKKAAERAINDPATKNLVEYMIFKGLQRQQQKQNKEDKYDESLMAAVKRYFGFPA